MGKKILMALGCVALAAAVWASNDPWKDKPYQQWDAKDLQRIFQDSPWSHVVRVDATWAKGGGNGGGNGVGAAPTPSGGSGGSSGGGSRMGGSSGSGGGGYGNSGGGSSGASSGYPSGGDAGGGDQSASFVIRWISSRTFREAMLRDRVLRGQMTDAEAQADLAKPVEGIELAVLGPDMTPFQGMDETALKSAATLTPKHTKTKIAPTEVRIQKSQDGSKISGILFVFPAKASNGETTISAEEKNVEFVVTAGKLTLKSAFEISKMADSQGRDI